MNADSRPHGAIKDPSVLRDLFGIRFHHFHDLSGRLVATIATEPVPDVVDDGDGQPLIAVSAAIAFSGVDPVRGLMADIEAAIRDGEVVYAQSLCFAAVELVERGAVRTPDHPTREIGRRVALGRLESSDTVLLTVAELKRQITERTILQLFHGGSKLVLRPRAPFVPRSRR